MTDGKSTKEAVSLKIYESAEDYLEKILMLTERNGEVRSIDIATEIHSEAFAAGEMKHGPISLIEKNMLVVGVLTQPDLYEKMVSNLVEAKSRGAYIMGLTTYGNYSIEDTANFTVYVPKTDPHFATSLSVVPLQLLAYYVSCAKGLDVDKPRNLAKSVTVE